MKHLYLSCILVLSLFVGCGKEEKENDPQPTSPTAPAIQWTVGTMTFSKTRVTYTFTPNSAPQNSSGADVLHINGVSASTTGLAEVIDVYYRKPPGSADTQYKLSVIYVNNGLTRPEYTANPSGAITKTSTGYAGTFAASRVNGAGSIIEDLKQGTFTAIP